MNSISYKRRKIIVGNRSLPLRLMLLPVANAIKSNSEAMLGDVQKSSSNRDGASSSSIKKRAAAADAPNNKNDVSHSKRRLRILLAAATQVTDDEGDGDDHEGDHQREESKSHKDKKNEEVASRDQHKEKDLDIRRHGYRFPAHLPMGRPLPPPPRLPNVPAGYKITTAIIGQL